MSGDGTEQKRDIDEGRWALKYLKLAGELKGPITDLLRDLDLAEKEWRSRGKSDRIALRAALQAVAQFLIRISPTRRGRELAKLFVYLDQDLAALDHNVVAPRLRKTTRPGRGPDDPETRTLKFFASVALEKCARAGTGKPGAIKAAAREIAAAIGKPGMNGSTVIGWRKQFLEGYVLPSELARWEEFLTVNTSESPIEQFRRVLVEFGWAKSLSAKMLNWMNRL